MNANFFELKGLRIKQIEGASKDSENVRIVTDATKNPTFHLYHEQDC